MKCLYLEQCKHVKDRAFVGDISALKCLEVFSVAGCRNLAGSFLATSVASWDSITNINVSGTGMSEKDSVALADTFPQVKIVKGEALVETARPNIVEFCGRL